MRLARPKFRLSTLLLLTLAVACWFGGMRFERWAGEKPVSQILIAGPPSPKMFVVPTPAVIASELEKAGRINRLPKNYKLILDPIGDYHDPPDSSGGYVHHSRYKCQIIGDEGTRTIYIDYDHQYSPSAPSQASSPTD
jgi:hypothetical protein